MRKAAKFSLGTSAESALHNTGADPLEWRQDRKQLQKIGHLRPALHCFAQDARG